MKGRGVTWDGGSSERRAWPRRRMAASQGGAGVRTAEVGGVATRSTGGGRTGADVPLAPPRAARSHARCCVTAQAHGRGPAAVHAGDAERGDHDGDAPHGAGAAGPGQGAHGARRRQAAKHPGAFARGRVALVGRRIRASVCGVVVGGEGFGDTRPPKVRVSRPCRAGRRRVMPVGSSAMSSRQGGPTRSLQSRSAARPAAPSSREGTSREQLPAWPACCVPTRPLTGDAGSRRAGQQRAPDGLWLGAVCAAGRGRRARHLVRAPWSSPCTSAASTHSRLPPSNERRAVVPSVSPVPLCCVRSPAQGRAAGVELAARAARVGSPRGVRRVGAGAALLVHEGAEPHAPRGHRRAAGERASGEGGGGGGAFDGGRVRLRLPCYAAGRPRPRGDVATLRRQRTPPSPGGV